MLMKPDMNWPIKDDLVSIENGPSTNMSFAVCVRPDKVYSVVCTPSTANDPYYVKVGYKGTVVSVSPIVFPKGEHLALVEMTP